MARETVYVQVDRIVKITEGAVLVEIDPEEVWIPRSQIEDDTKLKEGDEDVRLEMTEWFARKENLIDE